MSELAETHAVESVPGIPVWLQNMVSGVMEIEGQLIVLTWIAFILAAIALHKLLWKPILKAVGDREKTISDALAEAEQARRKVAETETIGKELVQKAEDDARAVAQRATRDAAAIRAKADADAREDAAHQVQNARNIIEAESRKAFEALRLNAADRLTDTLERMLSQNLTDEQKRIYQEDLLKEVKL